jgi:hypothetical protein
MVFKPHEEAFFQLTTERLAERGDRAILKLGIHPEMERPAILKRSIPSTAGVIISVVPQR